MSVNDRFKELLSQQKELTNKYNKLVEEISQDELINENIQLKERLKELAAATVTLEDKCKTLEGKNTNLQTALHDQFISERTQILNSSRKKALIYFGKAMEPYRNKLQELEANINKNIRFLTNIVNNKINDEQQSYLDELEDIKGRIRATVQDIEDDIRSRGTQFDENISRGYSQLDSEELSPTIIKKQENNNNIELKIGLNVINKVAIFVLLIGVITAAQYTFVNWFDDLAKGISIFALGLAFLGAGEWLYKKGKKVFSVGLIGGGIGILYVATYVSYFILGIIGIYFSLILSVVITIGAISLSLIHKSKTICSLSLIGGYLPLFAYYSSFGLDSQAAYISMAYLILLNVFVLIISFRNKWMFIKLLSFALNLPAMIMLVNNFDSDTIGIVYVLVVFLMYTVITLINPLLNKRNLNIWEIALLAVNTFVKSIFLYNIFPKDYRGLLALIFALVYLVLAQLVRRNTENERKTQALFYITSLTFALLMVPFQFGIVWTSMGWLIESVLLIGISKRLKDRYMALAGWIIFGLGFIAFVNRDLLGQLDYLLYYSNPNDQIRYILFNTKYAVYTLGLMTNLSMYLPELKESIVYRKSTKGVFLNIYKYFTLSFVWAFLMYAVWFIYSRSALHDYMVEGLTTNMYNFYRIATYGLVTLLYGFILSKIRLMKFSGMKVFVSTVYLIGFIYAIVLSVNTIATDYVYTYHEIIGLVILAVFNVLVYLSLSDVLMGIVEAKKMRLQYLPLILGVYTLGISISYIIYQFDLGNINLVTSIFIVLVSLIYIIIGFNKKLIYLRRLGLGLAIVALAKLFIFDLSHLDLLGKIIAYFSYGLILLGISFVYQKIKNLIDSDE